MSLVRILALVYLAIIATSLEHNPLETVTVNDPERAFQQTLKDLSELLMMEADKRPIQTTQSYKSQTQIDSDTPDILLSRSDLGRENQPENLSETQTNSLKLESFTQTVQESGDVPTVDRVIQIAVIALTILAGCFPLWKLLTGCRKQKNSPNKIQEGSQLDISYVGRLEKDVDYIQTPSTFIEMVEGKI